MRDFTVADPDGHRITLGRGEDRLRDVAGDYRMTAEGGLSRSELMRAGLLHGVCNRGGHG